MFTSSYLEVLMFQVHAKPCKQYNELRSMKLYINIFPSLLHPPLGFGISRICIHWETQWMQRDEALSLISHFLSGNIRMKTNFKNKKQNSKQMDSKFSWQDAVATYIYRRLFSFKNIVMWTHLCYMLVCVFAHPSITGAGQGGVTDTVVLSLHCMSEGTEAKTSRPSKWEAWENAAIPWL